MRILFFVFLACVCLTIYSGYLYSGFVFDDQVLVQDNPLIKSARLLPRVFKTDIYEYWIGQQLFDRMYRPLQMVSYYLDYNLWGVNPAGFRFTNLFLHLVNAVLVFYLIWMLFKNNLLAGATSLLFLVHPVQISSIAYISARGDLLSGLFILSGCILFIKFLNSSDIRFYLLSVLSGALALLSRENALLLIFFLFLFSFLVSKRKPSFKIWSGFFILYIFYFFIRVIALGPTALATHAIYLQGGLKLANFSNVIFNYFLLLLWPQNLGMFHLIDFIQKLSGVSLYFFVSGLLIVLSVFVFWFKKRRFAHPVLKFSLFWFLIGMLPVYLYFDAYPALGKALMAESWLYLPSIGFFAAVSYFCLLYKKGRFIIFAWALILGSVVLANRVYWGNEVIFYQRAMRFLPEDNIFQKKLASAYIRRGDFLRARLTIERLAEYHPDSPVVNFAWAQYYQAIGRPAQAIGYYQRVLGRSFLTDYYLSLCYSNLGDPKNAIVFGKESFNLNPLYLPNIIQLAVLYKESGEIIEANNYINLANLINPKYKQILFK